MGQDFLVIQYPGTLQNAWSRSEGSPQSFRPAEAKADGATLNFDNLDKNVCIKRYKHENCSEKRSYSQIRKEQDRQTDRFFFRAKVSTKWYTPD